MGYRSDVIVAVVVPEAVAKELVALYAMNPLVQEHRLVSQWQIYKTTCNGTPAVIFESKAEGEKWYESYPEVQGIEHLPELIAMLDEKREDGFPAATCCIRVGEEEEDISLDYTEYSMEKLDEFGDYAGELLREMYYVSREIVIEVPWDTKAIEHLWDTDPEEE